MLDAAVLDSSQCRTGCIVAQGEGVPVIPVRASNEVTLYPRCVVPHVVRIDLVRERTRG
jgi:hypothetical protein